MNDNTIATVRLADPFSAAVNKLDFPSYRDDEDVPLSVRGLFDIQREIIAAHKNAVAKAVERATIDAEAAGYARAMARIDGACERLEGPRDGELVISRIHADTIYTDGSKPTPGHWDVSGVGGSAIAPTPTAAILAADALIPAGGGS